ncbi:MAG: DUF1761 family protein [Pseudohongiellaceae bacterium]
MELFADVNWLATLVSAVVSFMLGAVWYSKYLFGEKWAAGVGVPFGPDEKQPAVALILQMLGTLLLAIVVGVSFAIALPELAILIGLFASLLMMAGAGFSKSSNYAVLAEGGFVIAMVAIMMTFQLVFS